jgi:succinyldiaminopimelate transaminase
VRLNPVLESLGTYPFVRLDEAKRAAAARGIELIDFGIGEPREETPEFIRRALAASLAPVSTYPKAEGLPVLREAIARWVTRRFGGFALDPATEIIPTLGSKEAIFHMAEVLGGDAVGVTVPGYPVGARGALFAGREVVEIPLDPAAGFLPDLDALDGATLDRLGLLWLNFPNNPTGAVASLELLERAAALAREHDFVLACDEAYSEIWLSGQAPVSALQLADRTNVVVLNTLSKRSSMPGYRSGFVAGDPRLIAALRRYRPNVGVAPQEFVQLASVAAWDDDRHVEEVRERYCHKRDLLWPALQAAGFGNAGGPATFFLWLTTPDGEDDEACAVRLLEHGVVCAPGSFFGAGGAGHVRFALVPTPEACAAAAQRLRA